MTEEERKVEAGDDRQHAFQSIHALCLMQAWSAVKRDYRQAHRTQWTTASPTRAENEADERLSRRPVLCGIDFPSVIDSQIAFFDFTRSKSRSSERQRGSSVKGWWKSGTWSDFSPTTRAAARLSDLFLSHTIQFLPARISFPSSESFLLLTCLSSTASDELGTWHRVQLLR